MSDTPLSLVNSQSSQAATPAPQPTQPLLVEIGCEEIPARFLTDAEKQFGERLMAALSEARLLPCKPEANSDGCQPDGEARTTYSTPRRLVVRVPAVLSQQPDLEEQVMGPAAKVAFDAAGKPTRAAESFAAKNGVKVQDLLQIDTPKGPYIAATKRTPGRAAGDVLAELLPRTIKSIAFPKSMIWESTDVRFVRPIRWILALLGEGDEARTIGFELAGVASGNQTQGHRGAGSDGIAVESFADYAQKLRRHFVEFDPESRRQSVRSEVNVVLEPWQDAVADPDLEEWVVNSTEWVAGLRGGFEARYLELPREILVTVMRDHQKYFAVEDREGRLQPNFVTLLNRDRDKTGVIRAGHERVLKARFSDAEFFWNADQRTPLRDRGPMLERVTYHAKLGSYGHKVERMAVAAEHACATLDATVGFPQDQRTHVLRAIRLCKMDLTTQMVQEFTELQGVVGGLYARTQGEAEEVWQAIYDHYRPVNVEDLCPRSVVGAIVSLADKLDAIVAGFSVGLEPTGSSDPFGLRRAGNGVVKVGVEKLSNLDLRDLADGVVPRSPSGEPASWLDKVQKFLSERVEYYLREIAGLRHDTARAVVNCWLGWGKPADAKARGMAVERIRDSADFLTVSHAAKRTRNILQKSAAIDYKPGIDNVRPDLFQHSEEQALYDGFRGAWTVLLDLEKDRQYDELFRQMATMGPVIDKFFDKVLVMAEASEVRKNRLTLLNSLNNFVFSRYADLSEIESAAPEKS